MRLFAVIYLSLTVNKISTSVADPHHFDNAHPDPACLFDSDPDPSIQMKVKDVEKVLKEPLYFWIVIWKLMRAGLRIKLINLIQSGSSLLL